MKRYLLSLLLLFIVFTGKGQFVNFGQDPALLRWRQIKTDDFQLIYPDFFEDNAQKIANIYTKLYQHPNSLAHKPARISMIIHPSGGISNGSVSWAPKQTNLYTLPPQEPSDSWLEHLCVHEFRHVVQIDKVDQGFTQILYYIFGESATIAVAGLYIPNWFLEGDAVTFETAVGHLGRGRSPEFLNEMKAQIAEKGIYTYDKAALGSYKDFVPNQYTMGYFMVGNARANYGNEIWQKALTYVGRHPLGFNSFARSLKRTLNSKRDSLWNDSLFHSLFINPDSVKKQNTYKDAKKTLYYDNFTELRQLWQEEAKTSSGHFDTIPTSNKYYSNYYYPTPTPDGKLIAYKKGLQQNGAFVMLGSGKEKLLTRTGSLDDYKFTLKNDKIIWSEYRPNKRWANGGRMTLTSYDLRSNRYKYHKSPNNRFSPFSINDQWGVVEVSDDNRASIVILDPSMKNEITRINADEDELFIHPSFDGQQITTVVQSTKGIRLEKINYKTGKREKLSDNYRYELDNPVMLNNDLLYRASFNGNNSFYLQNGSEDSVHNILNSRFGVRYPALNSTKDTLFFSFYTSDGYKPGKTSIRDLKKEPVRMERFRLADTLKKEENWQLNFNAGSDSGFASRRYRKFPHLFNIHSWGPAYINQYDSEIDLGLVVSSQNQLNTLALSAGYIKHSGFEHGVWMLNLEYRGIWPIFSLDFKTGRDDYNSTVTNALDLHTGKTDTLYIRNKARRSSGEVTMRLPFNLSVKNYGRSLTPYVRYSMEAIHNTKVRQTYKYTTLNDNIWYFVPTASNNYQLSFPANYYQILEYGVMFSNQTRMTVQEINPRWGQILQAGYAHTPLKKIDLGHEWWASGQFYFPGILKNHSLAIYAGYQNRPKYGYYDKKILSPRGISLYGYEMTSLRTSYKLPLLFPDQHITSLLYIKGIDGGVFFDMANNRSLRGKDNFYSYGAEITAKSHLLRLQFPVTFGVRTGYETQQKSMFANVIFSIGLGL